MTKLKKFFFDISEETITLFILVAIGIVSFIVFCSYSGEQMSNEQFLMCEEVAQKVYDQGKESFIVENPDSENFEIKITQTAIIVSLKQYRGRVVASLSDGKLVMTRDFQIYQTIIESLLFSGLTMIMMIMVLWAQLIYLENQIQKSYLKSLKEVIAEV